MLTLTRKVGQTIKLELENGDVIDVVVKEIRRNQVRLGVCAPRAIDVHREEVWERIQDEEEAA